MRTKQKDMLNILTNINTNERDLTTREAKMKDVELKLIKSKEKEAAHVELQSIECELEELQRLINIATEDIRTSKEQFSNALKQDCNLVGIDSIRKLIEVKKNEIKDFSSNIDEYNNATSTLKFNIRQRVAVV